MNENLKGFEGALPVIKVDLSRTTVKSGGRSGFKELGNYELETLGVELVKKSGSDEQNLKYTDRVIGPDGEGDGTLIITFHPAPIGEGKRLEDANSFLMQRLRAYASHGNKDPEGVRAVTELAEQNFVGKKFFATLKPGTGEYADSSGIDGYRMRKEFEARPGRFQTAARPSAAAQALSAGGTPAAAAAVAQNGAASHATPAPSVANIAIF